MANNALAPLARGCAQDYTAVVYVQAGSTTPYDLSSLSGTQLTWAASYTGLPPALIRKTIGAGITITDAANGKITLSLADADTALVRQSSGPVTLQWVLVLTDGAGKSYPIDGGTLPVETYPAP